MTTETCRDVLADMLATASNMSDLADALDSYGYPTARIRAAIAADDAERERLRRIEEAARAVDARVALCVGATERERADAIDALADVISLMGETLLSPTMRQLDAAQRLAGEMPEVRRQHARAAVDGGRDDG